MKKKFKLAPQNLFIIASIIFLGFLVCFYTYRLVYYYKLDHPELGVDGDELITVADKVITYLDIAETGNGLYEEDGTYYFKGQATNNYLLYSGRLWRIVSLDKDKNIKLITEDSQTLLSYGHVQTFNESYLNLWLNEQETSYTGFFYRSLNNPLEFLTETATCLTNIDDLNSSCEDYKKDAIGLLSIDEYKKAGANKSYLNNNTYYWLANITSSKEPWYVFDKGGLGKEELESSHNYGVRPTITLKASTKLIKGKGTIDDPFIIEEPSDSYLKNKNIGEYLIYNGYKWRIIDCKEEYVKVALDGYLKVDNKEYMTAFSNTSNVFSKNKDNIGYYLNNTFYKTLEDKDYLVMGTWYTGAFDSLTKNDYRDTYKKNFKAYVGLYQMGEFYLNEYGNTYTLTGVKNSEDAIYTVSSDNKLYVTTIDTKLKVRPLINLKGDLLTLSGDGSKTNPYMIGR